MPCIRSLLCAAFALPIAAAAASSPQAELDAEAAKTKWGFTWGYSGVSTFGHLNHTKCLLEPGVDFDIGVIGVPFDTAASYRPGRSPVFGARFGPRAIRAASNRHLPSRGFSPYSGINPYMSWAKILDCGDVPVTPFDNELALRQMTEALEELAAPRPTMEEGQEATGTKIPRLLVLGGDHSVALPALRAMAKAHGEPVALVHFDAHLDTLHPSSYPSVWSSTQSEFTHGSMFWQAGNEGLLANGSSIHAGLRTRITGDDWADYVLDDQQGFVRLLTEDIDEMGPKGIVDAIVARVGETRPVYLSIDIDVLDPSIAPGTGAPEPGGWTMREMNKIIRGLDRLNIVGADIVEVAPAFDDRGEGTAFAAAQLAYEIMTIWVKQGMKTMGEKGELRRKAKDEL
ncbi:arginase family-domain-containing protein [Aspergillus egyptiacus]|nr:arginase family-domain-containing protein [Aspergillus egyptiacus]